MSTAEKILEYITKNGQASGKELSNFLDGITSRAVRKQLKNLTEKGRLQKIGRPPKVYYLLKTNKESVNTFQIDKQIQNIIDEKYLYISPTGEATKRIPDNLKILHPEIPWRDMAGMRDILIHQYTEVDEDIVWKTVTQKISTLKENIESILNKIS